MKATLDITLNPEFIASVCHEANRLFCKTIGDESQVEWQDAPEWQRQSAITGVKWRQENMDAPCSAQHDSWIADKIADGWVYGEIKDAEKKTHPCLVSYEQLRKEQQFKDMLFVAIVQALTSPT